MLTMRLADGTAVEGSRYKAGEFLKLEVRFCFLSCCFGYSSPSINPLNSLKRCQKERALSSGFTVSPHSFIYTSPHNTMSSSGPPPAQKGSGRQYDPTFTDKVIGTCGPNTSPRMMQIFTGLVRHIHDFSREVDLTPEEWLAGVKFLNETGKIWADSAGKRNEMHRLSDIVGLES